MIAATRTENLATAVDGGVRGPMLAGGVVCSNDSSSAMAVALKKSGVERRILMMEGSRRTVACEFCRREALHKSGWTPVDERLISLQTSSTLRPLSPVRSSELWAGDLG